MLFTGGAIPSTAPGLDASPSPVPAPSNTPTPTEPLPTWLSGQAFMDVLSASEGHSWTSGKARGSMTTTAGDVMITVSPPLDRNAQVRIVEKAGDAPTSGTFEAALRIVSPDDVGWLAGAYRELAPYPDKTSQSIDLPTGTVSVSHEVTDGVSLWTMTFWPNYPVDPEDFPGEEPLE